MIQLDKEKGKEQASILNGEPKSPCKLSLPDFYSIHEVALDIHAAACLAEAYNILKAFALRHGLAAALHAEISESKHENPLVLPCGGNEIPPDDCDTKSPVSFDIVLPCSRYLRLSIVLPGRTSFTAQSMLELLLEHLRVAAGNLPLVSVQYENVPGLLTELEKAVIPLFLSGKPDRVAARELGIPPAAVKQTVDSLLVKFGQESRNGLILRYLNHLDQERAPASAS